VVPPLDINNLYGVLRAQILSRHFALGRYFRADHLSFENLLGVVHQSNGVADGTENDVIHDCIWSDALNGIGATAVQPTTYTSAADLLTKSPGEQLFARWQVADHSRANPLMYSGQLMVCLAVESTLGIPGSLEILTRLLSTTRSLFKFTTGSFGGYILRWDAITSDHWATTMGENAVTLDHCCDFLALTDPTTPDGYLYSTPLDDPRYTAYMASSDFGALSSQQQNAYFAARIVSLYQNRYWEPSQDELVGYLGGLSFVFGAVSDQAVRSEVASQAALVGGWLSANGYLSVRPNGGFAALGAAGVGSALEYPFGRIFARLTGSSFPDSAGFEGALQNAGLWPDFSAGFAAATLGGIVVAVLVYELSLAFATFGAAYLGAILGAVVAAGGSIVLAKALVLLLNSESFDVYAWPGNSSGIQASNGQQTQFVAAYLFSILPSQFRFWSWIKGLSFGLGKFAQNFAPFIGLSAFGDTDTMVRNAYLGWFYGQGGGSAAPPSFPPPPVGDDGQSDFPVNADPFATAVAVLLGAGVSEQTKLVALLHDLVSEFAFARKELLAVYDASSGTTPAPYFLGTPTTTLVDEPVRPALNYLAAVALAWFFSKLPTTDTKSLPPGFPTPPPAGTKLPRVTIPKHVVEQSFGLPATQQVIPFDGLPPLQHPLPHEIDLFGGGVPGKPAKPPSPQTDTTWILSTKKSHSGNWFGSKGVETLNQGQTLSSPGCVILGVKLFLEDRHGNPLGGVSTSVALGRASQEAGVPPWPSPRAQTGIWPFTAGARILSIGSTPADMTVTVRWWYSTGTACRYQIAYLVQGQNCSL
jgi:hypothetical protein